MTSESKFQSLHNNLLLLVQQERRLTSKILDLLQKVEDQKLYLNSGYANLFDYLVRGLGYSESLAYQRKAALKLCKVLPETKEKINQGALSLATIARANRVLNTKSIPEKRELLQQLENKSSRQVDKILARDNLVHNNMTQTFLCSREQYVRDQNQSGLIKVRVNLEFTEEEFSQLEKLKALKSHQVRDLKDLVNLLVDKELELYNRTSKLPSKSSNPRQIKISLKKYLLQKANYKCQHPGCEQTHFLQIDHIKSVFANGTNRPENLQVLCQQHNIHKFKESLKPK
jgi:hypothetical protein